MAIVVSAGPRCPMPYGVPSDNGTGPPVGGEPVDRPSYPCVASYSVTNTIIISLSPLMNSSLPMISYDRAIGSAL